MGGPAFPPQMLDDLSTPAQLVVLMVCAFPIALMFGLREPLRGVGRPAGFKK